MKCDNCGDDCRQATVCDETAGAYWCDRCCQAAGIKVMRAAEVSVTNEIRARWEAEQAAIRAEKLEATLSVLCVCGHERRGHTRKHGCKACDCYAMRVSPAQPKIDCRAPETAKKATPEGDEMSKEKNFKPCKQGKHEECTGAYWEDETLAVAVKCKCDCHHPLAQTELFSAPRRESKQPSLFN